MKVKSEIVIDVARENLWRVFDDSDKLKEWQPQLTITEQSKPNFIAGIFTTRWSKAVVVYHLETHANNRTRCIVHGNHQFKGLNKLASVFVRRAILDGTDEDLQRLKQLAEAKDSGQRE